MDISPTALPQRFSARLPRHRPGRAPAAHPLVHPVVNAPKRPPLQRPGGADSADCVVFGGAGLRVMCTLFILIPSCLRRTTPEVHAAPGRTLCGESTFS